MIVIALAAALIAPTSGTHPAPKPSHPAVQPAVQTPSQAPSVGPVLSSVAVTLECTARASGRVENCHVLGETHPGLGFGDAAIALMRDAQVDPGPQDVQFARTIQFMP